jgi:D-methionine transport system ATP-binding protein
MNSVPNRMVRIENVSVTFNVKGKETRAVRDVTLDINRGEIFGIVGTSGAGKSTLIRTINLLEKPARGRIFIEDEDITDLKENELRTIRQKIGFVFQHFNLIHTKTVFDNIAFPMKIAGKGKEEISRRVPELLALVGLDEKMYSYPARLSGGQKQRVGIARAIANDPILLLCDEPTSALDIETTRSILALIREINDKLGITVIIISHEMEVIKSVCTNVAVMSEGEVVEVKPAYEIFANPSSRITRELVRHSLNLEIPGGVLATIRGTIVKITYRGDAALEPVLSDAIKKYRVRINILHGKIEYIAERPIGIFFINIRGKKGEITKTMSYFRRKIIDAEVIHG